MDKEFEEVSERVGPDNAMDFNDVRRISRSRKHFNFWSLLHDPLRELPQVRATLAGPIPGTRYRR